MSEKPAIVVTYTLYKKISGEGPEYRCDVRENGQAGLLFGGATPEEAQGRAAEYANKIDTEERRARIAESIARKHKRRNREALETVDE